MSAPPVIVALDIATTTGVVIGRPGEKPTVAIINLRDAGTERPRRLCYLWDQCTKMIRQYGIEQVRYEKPLPLRVAIHVGASEDVLLMLRGAIGVVEAAAIHAGVSDVGSYDIKDARKYLTGYRTFPKGKDGTSQAKVATLKAASMLCKDVKTFDEADAYAGWAYSCGQHNPRYAMAASPLFAR